MYIFQALVDIVNKISQSVPQEGTGKRTYTEGAEMRGRTTTRVKPESTLTTNAGGLTKQRSEKPFDGMNNIVANMLLNMTR